MLERIAREARTAGEGVDILRRLVRKGVREKLVNGLRDLNSIEDGTSPDTIKARLSGPIQHFRRVIYCYRLV